MKRIHHRLCDTHTQTEYTDFKDHTRSLTHHHLTMQLVCEAGPGRGNSTNLPKICPTNPVPLPSNSHHLPRIRRAHIDTWNTGRAKTHQAELVFQEQWTILKDYSNTFPCDHYWNGGRQLPPLNATSAGPAYGPIYFPCEPFVL